MCADPCHVVQLATKAMNEVRRQVWNNLRDLADPRYAKAFKGGPLVPAEEPGGPLRHRTGIGNRRPRN